MFLLLELLDDGVIEMHGQSIQGGGSFGSQIAFLRDIAPQAADHPNGKQECAPRHDQTSVARSTRDC